MPRKGERAKEDHPWRKKATPTKIVRPAWVCPNCGLVDCAFEACLQEKEVEIEEGRF